MTGFVQKIEKQSDILKNRRQARAGHRRRLFCQLLTGL